MTNDRKTRLRVYYHYQCRACLRHQVRGSSAKRCEHCNGSLCRLSHGEKAVVAPLHIYESDA